MSESPLWRWPQLCEACAVPVVSGPDIQGISIDSRAISKGDLFIALAGDPGPRFHSSGSSGRDGHEFIDAAIDAGASGLMVARQVATQSPALVVADTLDGLWALGRASRARMQGKVVAITGSSGKTTARQWLEQILQHVGRTHASTGSLNNHWGVPLSLARMPADSEFGVFEVGTNNSGEIRPLSELIAPDVALVLNVLPAHLGRFTNIEALAEEKLSIERGLGGKGTLVVPLALRSKVTEGDVLTFGLDPAADVSGTATPVPGGTEVVVSIGSKHWTYEFPANGVHRIETSLAVCAMLHALGVDLAACVPWFRELVTPSGRGNALIVGDKVIIDDSYNANPVSVRHALNALAEAPGQRVAILGEMLELGDAAIDLHASVADACAGLDGVITVGAGFRNWPGSRQDNFWGHYADASDVDLDALVARLVPGATVLVKGANKVFWVNGFVPKLTGVIGAAQDQSR